MTRTPSGRDSVFRKCDCIEGIASAYADAVHHDEHEWTIATQLASGAHAVLLPRRCQTRHVGRRGRLGDVGRSAGTVSGRRLAPHGAQGQRAPH